MLLYSRRFYGWTAAAGAVAVVWACCGRPDTLRGLTLLAGVFAVRAGGRLNVAVDPGSLRFAAAGVGRLGGRFGVVVGVRGVRAEVGVDVRMRGWRTVFVSRVDASSTWQSGCAMADKEIDVTPVQRDSQPKRSEE